MSRSTRRPRKRKEPKAKARSFDARLNEEQKVLEERAMLILSARATEAFADAILHPAEPGPVLRAAARRYNT